VIRRAAVVAIIALTFGSGFWSDRNLTCAEEYSTRTAPESIDLSHFPDSKYTPFGYLANPYHTSILNRSGILRSVPPLGFGYWARPLPWPYASGEFGFGLERHRNYLSFVHLSIYSNGTVLHTQDDFLRNEVELFSRYHTQNMMSYDFDFDGLTFRAMYFQVDEHSLVCRLQVKNLSTTEQTITIHATNTYGDVYKQYWGCDGIVSRYEDENDLGVSKVYADGDVFVLGADKRSLCYKATADDEQWDHWIAENNLSSAKENATSIRFGKRGGSGGGHVRTVMSYQYTIAPSHAETITVCLTRGVTERNTVARFHQAISKSKQVLQEKLQADRHFYAGTPVLSGDWPQSWKNGLVYHFETIRMNIHPPVGIYKHHWDGMQIHTPRTVLGEAGIDSMCLSYADIGLAKEVLLGTFADALAPNIPCSREDGTINLIGGNGDECGTAPIWGLPFHVIHSIYLRDCDQAWIKKLYPHMKAYLQWWINNRTDEDGWFHASNSLESGQDASKRFLVEDSDPAAAAKYVRTVDIEAAMANAMNNMILFAKVAGEHQDVTYWNDLANKRIESTRSMFVDGEFRDIDARNGKPIILEDYHSIMMLAPIALGIATAEQMENSAPLFSYFQQNYQFWLEWASFLFPFSEAAWNAGQRKLLAEVLVNTGDGIFPGMDSREVFPVKSHSCPGLPEEYSYRTPGVAGEWWPHLRKQDGKPDEWSRGCENYGWGATFPTLLIRNLIGFREVNNLKQSQFHLAPALPPAMFEIGKTYGITNLCFRGYRINVDYTIMSEDIVRVHLKCRSPRNVVLRITDDHGDVVVESDHYGRITDLSFDGENGGLYTVTLIQ